MLAQRSHNRPLHVTFSYAAMPKKASKQEERKLRPPTTPTQACESAGAPPEEPQQTPRDLLDATFVFCWRRQYALGGRESRSKVAECGEHMIWPLPGASDLTAFRRCRGGPKAELHGGADGVLGRRVGAGDEDSGGDPEGAVGRDSLVSGSLDLGVQRADDPTLPSWAGEVGLRGSVRSSSSDAFAKERTPLVNWRAGWGDRSRPSIKSSGVPSRSLGGRRWS